MTDGQQTPGQRLQFRICTTHLVDRRLGKVKTLKQINLMVYRRCEVRCNFAAMLVLLLGMPSVLPADELPAELTEEWHGVTFVQIRAGEFTMGSDETAVDLAKAGIDIPDALPVDDERPAHRVRLSAFRIGKYEVTRGQFRIFVEMSGYRTEAEKDPKGGWGVNRQKQMPEQHPRYNWTNSGYPQTDDHPVGNVSWNDALAYCRWMTTEYQKRGKTITCRLPTEAEWEYACRAGSTTRFATGDAALSLNGFANLRDASFAAEYPNQDYNQFPAFSFNDGAVFTTVAGKYKANAFGLHDMHGNVWEWCGDWYDKKYYSSSPGTDPQGPQTGSSRVLRGSSWDYLLLGARCSDRSNDLPSYRSDNTGFRVVLR
ncbi:MAG: hypothetical protein RLZZ458_2070 [Planctomycetota bacterium]